MYAMTRAAIGALLITEPDQAQALPVPVSGGPGMPGQIAFGKPPASIATEAEALPLTATGPTEHGSAMRKLLGEEAHQFTVKLANGTVLKFSLAPPDCNADLEGSPITLHFERDTEPYLMTESRCSNETGVDVNTQVIRHTFEAGNQSQTFVVPYNSAGLVQCHDVWTADKGSGYGDEVLGEIPIALEVTASPVHCKTPGDNLGTRIETGLKSGLKGVAFLALLAFVHNRRAALLGVDAVPDARPPLGAAPQAPALSPEELALQALA